MSALLVIAGGLLAFQCWGLFMQIVTTYRLKDSRGISISTVMLFFTGALFLLPYSYYGNVPSVYLVGFTVQTILISTLLYLCYRYRQDISPLFFYGGTLSVIGGAAALTACKMNELPTFDGASVAGWLMLIVSSIRNFPQIWRTFQRKSTHGISIFAVSTEFIAGMLHLSVGIIYDFSIQLIIAYIRLMALAGVQLFQFWIYRKRNDRYREKE